MLVRADYDRGSPSATFDSPGTETVAAVGNSQRLKEDPKVGDFDQAFAVAAVTLDARYATATQHHNPIELFSTTAVWSGDDLTVYEPSQNVNGWRHQIAEQLKINPAHVRVISPYIGGAFGSKGPMTPRTTLVALAAKRLNRPVRCVVSRMQGFTTATYRAETRHHLRIGAGHDGKITAFSHEGWEVTSRPDPYVVAGTETTARLYGYGSVWTKVNLVRADRSTPGYMRSPPETPYVFALESAMDEMAVKLGMDPVEFRRVNDTPKEPIKGAPFTSRSLMACFDQAAAAFGWSRRNPAIRSMREGDWLIGFGCATAVYPTNIAPAAARVSLDAEGKVRLQTASHEIGTGVRTVAAQTAAEHLGVEVSAVQVEMGDSALPPAPVAGGSNSTASVCSTVIKACEAIRDKLARAAVAMPNGPLANRDPASLRLEGASLRAADGARQPLSDVFKGMGVGEIEENAQFLPAGLPPEALQRLYSGVTTMMSGIGGDKIRMAFGAEFVEVRINARTRDIRVPRLVGAFAAGRIMNTRTASSQLMGGMIWGIGAALHERTEIDPRDARYVNRDLQDYYVPVNSDIQQL